MKNPLYDYGYGSDWKDVHISKKSGYYSSVADFHEHNFYEINLILSGNVRILLSDRTEEASECRMVLTKPDTPHFISCKPDTLYSRIYLLFSEEFIADYIPEWKQLSLLFGKKGQILTLNEEQKDFCLDIMEKIQKETDNLRKRLLILYLLSYIGDFSEINRPEKAPSYLIDILSYINENYADKITALSLAERFYMGRTTLVTSFKKYTGSTLNQYIVHLRLKKAISFIKDGKTLQEAAELCGFNDSSTLIKSFKKNFGTTPKKYIEKGPML